MALSTRPNDNTYWVIPGKVLAGEYPADRRGEDATRQKLRNYLNHGITTFIDLTQEGERETYEGILKQEAASMNNIKVNYQRIPVQDFGIPSQDTMHTILEAVDSAVKDKHSDEGVYVHCRGGIGRTGTTVGCFLASNGMSGEEALAETNRLFQVSGRSRESAYSPETRDQMQFVQNWKSNTK